MDGVMSGLASACDHYRRHVTHQDFPYSMLRDLSALTLRFAFAKLAAVPPNPLIIMTMRPLLLHLLLAFALTSAAFGQFESQGVGPDVNLAPAQRPWTLWTRAYAAYDSNVQQVGDSFFRGNNSSSVAGFTLAGSYRLYDQNDWVVGASIRFDQLVYFDQSTVAPAAGGTTFDASDFNYTMINPAIYVARKMNTGGAMPMTARVVYDFRGETAQALGGNYHTVGTGLAVDLTEAWSADLFYSHGWDDYQIRYADNTGDLNRDSQRDSLTLSTNYLFNQKRSRIGLAYSVMKNDADGQAWAFEGQAVNLFLKTKIAGPVAALLQVGYAHRDYNGYTSPTFPGRTETDVYSAGLQLVYKITNNWSADVFYNYSRFKSDTSPFNANRSTVGLGVRYDF